MYGMIVGLRITVLMSARAVVISIMNLSIC